MKTIVLVLFLVLFFSTASTFGEDIGEVYEESTSAPEEVVEEKVNESNPLPAHPDLGPVPVDSNDSVATSTASSSSFLPIHCEERNQTLSEVSEHFFNSYPLR